MRRTPAQISAQLCLVGGVRDRLSLYSGIESGTLFGARMRGRDQGEPFKGASCLE